MDEAAQQVGESYGGYLAFEEDCDAAVVLFEHPELVEQLSFLNTTKEALASSLLSYNREYLASRGYHLEVLAQRLRDKLPISW